MVTRQKKSLTCWQARSNMKVAVVYQYFQGRGEPGHSIVYEMAHYLAEHGYRVRVLAGETGYMKRGTISHRPWFRRLFQKEHDGGVSIIRTYTYPDLHRNYLTRLLGFFSFSLSCAIALLWIDRPDVLWASSPPLFPIFSAGLVCKLRKIPFVFEVRDLWPASAVQMGILRSRWQIRLMAWMERWLYSHSQRITARTEGIRSDICRRGWQKDKVVFIPCGVDSEWLYPDTQAGVGVRKRHGWEGKKIILYFGALGEANNLSVVLKAAHRLRDRSDTLFVLVGDGMKRQAIEDQRKAMGLGHVWILPPVPKQEARGYINAADLCVVTLQDIPLFEGAIPNKLLEYLACGKPVVCGIRGEAERIIRAAQAGVVFEPNDDARLAELIRELIADDTRTAALAANGPVFIQKHFSALEMRERMEKVLSGAAGCR
jgi:glycosyltransferase involved in cell wall biosynthesis